MHRLRSHGDSRRYTGSRLSDRTVRFLVDRCAGRRLADWLRNDGHDVLEARSLGPDPGDKALLELAESTDRVLVTIDTDFGELIYLREVSHAGLVRLPDVSAEQRIAMLSDVIEQHRPSLEDRSVVTIRGGRIRISRPPT
ncbi:MAG: hypothetical protein F4W93_10355 [Dehalococcoidia bacterium]|nr:hypothetical protein [Dehalococcoidia bacterium]